MADLIPQEEDTDESGTGQPESVPVNDVTELSAPTSAVNVGTYRPHMEATCIAFSRVFGANGSEWSLTLREGVTRAQVDHLFLAMKQTAVIGAKHGFAFSYSQAVKEPPVPPNSESQGETIAVPSRPSQSVPAVAPPAAPKSGPPVGGPPRPPAARTAAAGGVPGGWDKIIKVVIVPNPKDAEKPRVELWGKPALKYAVTSAPASLLMAKLSDKYGLSEEAALEAYGWMFTPGGPYTINWAVQIVDSETLNRSGKPYRNIGDIMDLDRERL
jgi:hypothetical protein